MTQLTEEQNTRNIMMVIQALNKLAASKQQCPTCHGKGYIV